MTLIDAVAPQKSDFARFKERLLGRTGEIPMNQVNAILPDRMQLRVGIPHRGGKLAVHAFERGYPVIVSANAFFDPKSETVTAPRPEEAVAKALRSIQYCLGRNGRKPR